MGRAESLCLRELVTSGAREAVANRSRNKTSCHVLNPRRSPLFAARQSISRSHRAIEPRSHGDAGERAWNVDHAEEGDGGTQDRRRGLAGSQDAAADRLPPNRNQTRVLARLRRSHDDGWHGAYRPMSTASSLLGSGRTLKNRERGSASERVMQTREDSKVLFARLGDRSRWADSQREYESGKRGVRVPRSDPRERGEVANGADAVKKSRCGEHLDFGERSQSKVAFAGGARRGTANLEVKVTSGVGKARGAFEQPHRSCHSQNRNVISARCRLLGRR